MRLGRLRTGVLAVAGALVVTVLPGVALPAAADGCPGLARAYVPGAERQEAACLADLTTAGTVGQRAHRRRPTGPGCTAAGTVNPSGVPGIQIDGYFPDTSTTQHQPRLEPRLPVRASGCPTGGTAAWWSPAPRASASSTPTTSRSPTGCWPAATRSPPPTRATPARTFYRDGAPARRRRSPEWNAARHPAHRRRQGGGRRSATAGCPRRTLRDRHVQRRLPGALAAGEPSRGSTTAASTGRARCSAPTGPNLLTYLPTALRDYPRYAAGRPGRRTATEMLAAGFAPGLGVPLGLPLPGLLGPHPADLPRGVRPRLRRRAGGRHPVLRRAARPNCDADYDYATPARAR